MASITGTPGNDLLPDTIGDDAILGLGGDDTITVTSGRDDVDGGIGTDRLVIDYGTSTASIVNIGETRFDVAGGGGTTAVTFDNVESFSVTTGSGDDTIRTFVRDDVSNTNNRTVLSGNDFISSGAGNDRIAGGGGNDELRGGTGNDIVDGDGSLRGKFGGNLGDIEFIGDDTLFGDAGDDDLYGGNGSDILNGGIGDDELYGDRSAFRAIDSSAFGGPGVQIQMNVGNDLLSGNDTLDGGDGNDILAGNAGNDIILGGSGNDTALVTVTSDGADRVDLGTGDDVVQVSANADSQVSSKIRLTFTSSEVGNGSAADSNTMAGQDGGLAVRLQSENYVDGLVGPVSRYDDEGITFVASNESAPQVTFDVRDLVTGAQRGDQFEVVTLGTSAGETINARFAGRATYINAGMGDDIVRGSTGNDFLVGGAGNDTLIGGAGRDGFLGGAGNDTINSVDAADSIFAGVIAPEADTVDAGAGDDTVTGGRRDTLIGGDGTDFLSINFDFDGPNLDPAAVTLALDATTGAGVANDGTSVAGFEFVDFNLTDFADTVNTGNVRATLTGNGGDDVLTTGSADDQVFGGSGNDTISTGGGNDTIGGGSGNDTIDGGAGDDRVFVDPSVDGRDTVNLGAGNDTVSFEGFAAGEIRVTFTSAEVGNGNAFDGNDNANEDGGLAVRVQREDANGNLIGEVSRYDDEGITFLEGTQGYTFDVRDLPTGAQRGNAFTGVVLGTSGDDNLTFFPPFRANQPFYYNAGMGNDTVIGGNGNDFLVGGAGNDALNGGGGDDTFIGGGGDDLLTGAAGNDTLDGGLGFDTAAFGFNFAQAVVSKTATGFVISGPQGTDTITNVENFRFADQDVSAINVFNDAPVIVADDLTPALPANALFARLGPDDLAATDEEGNPLTFTVTSLPAGTLLVDGEIAAPGAAFTPADIAAGRVTLLAGPVQPLVPVATPNGAVPGAGIAFADQFAFSVSDGTNTTMGTFTAPYAAFDTVQTAAQFGGFFGGNGNDYQLGTSNADNMSGGNGNDELIGGGGNDQLNGGEGNNRLFGQAGNDQLNGGNGNDLLDGGDGDDMLNGNGGDNILLGGLGNDQINSGEGKDVIFAGAGNDTINANGGNNRIDAGAGDDRITAGNGNDTVITGAGNDVVFANGGNNIFKLGGIAGVVDDGDDQYYSGNGADKFALFLDDRAGNAAGFGDDTAFGFRIAEGDQLVAFNETAGFWNDPAQLTSLVASGFISGQRSADGGDLKLTFAPGEAEASSVTLKWFFWDNSSFLSTSEKATANGAVISTANLTGILADVIQDGGDFGVSGPNFLDLAHNFVSNDFIL